MCLRFLLGHRQRTDHNASECGVARILGQAEGLVAPTKLGEAHTALRRAQALVEGHQMVKARVYDEVGQERFCVER